MRHILKSSFGLILAAGAAHAETIVQIPGIVSGFGTLTTDGIIDGAMVVPSLRSSEVLAFQPERLMSPSEKLQVGPIEADVPGNFFFPRQRERHGIIPVTLAKEQFTFTTVRGQSNELVTVGFRAPFRELVRLGQEKAPFTDLLAIVQFTKYDVARDRDWSQDRSLATVVANNFRNQLPYRWTRTAAPAGSSDLVVNFEKTPAARWMVADVKGNAQASGNLNTRGTAQHEFKTLFLRLDLNADKEISSGRGWIRGASSLARISVSNLPAALSNVAVNRARLTWRPVTDAGWMTIIRSQGEAPSSFGILARPTGVVKQEWVNAADGSYDLGTPLGPYESVALIFVGTDRAVPMPIPGNPEVEDPLFTYASEVRMKLMQ